MAVHRCPNCSVPYVDAEIEQGICPSCGTQLDEFARPARSEVPTPPPPAAPAPSRAVPFLLGLVVGGVVALGALWAALRMGTPLPGGGIEQTPTFQAVQAQKVEAETRVGEAEAGRQAAESAHAEAAKALEAANRKSTAALKQKEDTERQLKEVLARLTEERGHRTALEKTLAEEKLAQEAPALSFVRDWQLLGPFAAAGEQAHDTVFPPEREPVQLEKTYAGFGGRVKWRPYHSPEDKIDLAQFFDYRQGGAAYAVTWVHSDADQAVTLSLGSDDGARVWVNGEKVHDVKGGRQARPGQDMIKAHLKKGWNEVRVKVDNIIGTWEMYVEFRGADGAQPLKVASTRTPPPTR